MIAYCLRFASEAAATAVLYTTVDEIQDEDGNIIVQASVTPNYANISTIGIIYKPTGEVDADGNPVMAPVDGWHVNVLADEAPELSAYQVFPAVPMRVWAE